MDRFYPRLVKLLACMILIVMGLSAFTSVISSASDVTPSEVTTAAVPSFVKVGWTDYAESWNPLTLYTYADYVACSLTHSYLFTYDEDLGGAVKDLATGYLRMINFDGSMNTHINITHNAYFRNAANPTDLSHRLTAWDVKFTIDTIIANPGGSCDMFVKDITEVTVFNDYQLTIRTSYTKATLIDDLTSIPIIPMYLWSTVANPLAGKSPSWLAGSGPFMFSSEVLGAWSKFTKAPNYHGATDYPGARDVSIDGIIYTTYIDEAALTLAMNSGVEDVVSLTGNPNLYLHSLGVGSTVNVTKQAVSEAGMCDVAVNAIPMELRTSRWGTGNPLLLDPIVRKAIQMTLNKTAIVNTIMSGLPVMADSVLQPGYWHKDISPELVFDPTGAKALLMASGYADTDSDGILEATAGALPVMKKWASVGSELNFRLSTIEARSDYISTGSAWVAWAQQAGIRLMLTICSENQMVVKWYGADYDVWIWHWGWSPEPLSSLSLWLSSELTPGGNNVQMPMGPWYDSAKKLSAYDENYSLAQRTLNKADRKVVVDRLQQFIYDSYSENPPSYDVGLYGFTDERFVGWGDWESHPGRTIMSSFLWTWFDLQVRGGNTPPVFDQGLLSSYSTEVRMPIVFSVTVHDTDGDWIMLNWTFGDGAVEYDHLPVGSSNPTTVSRTHTYNITSTTGLQMHVTAHDGLQGHQVASYSVVFVWAQPTSRHVDYVWYDMFNVPFGEWWDTRWTYCAWQKVLTREYPYLYQQYVPPYGNSKVFSAMRLNISGEDLPEINMNAWPEFLPMLGTARGGNATVDWFMQYATDADMQRYSDVIGTWNDGYIVILNGTVSLDRDAAMTVLGLQSAEFDEFATWWGVNQQAITTAYSDWLNYEANKRLDIYNAYEFPMTQFVLTLDASKVGDNVVLRYDSVSWGMEMLMARWLHEAFVPAEWWFEGMNLHAAIGPSSSDIQIDTAVENAVFAWESNSDGLPCWRWEPTLADYMAPTPSHWYSDYAPYVGKSYISRAPESAYYGQLVPYEYTPTAFNLSIGETLNLVWPSGIQVFLQHYDGPTIPEIWLPRTVNVTGTMSASYSEPWTSDMPSNVLVNSTTNTISFKGPVDMWNWSHDQTAHSFLASEWDRVGALPYGIPMVEFRPKEIVAPVATSLSVSVSKDSLYVGEPAAITVKILDQYGGVFKQYTGTVSFWSSDSLAVLPPSYTFTVSDNGVKTFPIGSLVFNTPGIQVVHAVDDAKPGVLGVDFVDVIVNTPPVAYFVVDPEYGSLGTMFLVDARYSYDMESPVVARWDWESDGIWDTPWSSTLTADHIYDQFGSYVIRLEVMDTGGLVDGFSQMVSVGMDVVKAPGSPKDSSLNWTFAPTISGDWTIRVDNYMLKSLVLDMTDVTGGASRQVFHHKINLNQVDAYPTGQINFDPVQVVAGHIYELTATPWGRGGSHALVYGSIWPYVSPVADFTFEVNGLNVSFDASASMSYTGDIVSCVWDWGDGTSGTGMWTWHNYGQFGGYMVTLFVTDTMGLSSSVTKGVYVIDNVPPIADAGHDQFVYGADYIVLDGSGSTDNVGITSYEWSFFAGNGELRLYYGEIVTVPSERFFSYGNYTVTLAVRDADGNVAYDTVAIDFGFKIVGDAGVGFVTAQMPGVDCLWRVKFNNSGLTTLQIDILDVYIPGPSQWVYHATVSFVDGGAYPYGWLITEPVLMLAGHWYQIEFTTTGPAGTYAIEYDYLVPV